MLRLLLSFIITVLAQTDFQTTLADLNKKFHVDEYKKRADAIAKAAEAKAESAKPKPAITPKVYHKSSRKQAHRAHASFLETDASAPQVLSPKEFSDWLTNMYAKVDARREDDIHKVLAGELV